MAHRGAIDGRIGVLSLALLAPACAPAPGPREANPLEAAPVDTLRVRTAEEAAAWPHRQAVSADLDGDAREERIVLAADVTLDAAGRPLWEDGHRWAVFVDAPGGRTMLYAAFVPNGHVEAGVTTGGSDRRRRVVVEERTPGRLFVTEIDYDGPGRARTSSAAYSHVERWLPDLRESPGTPR